MKYIVLTIVSILTLNLKSQETLHSKQKEDKCIYCQGLHAHINPYKFSVKRELSFLAAGLGVAGGALILEKTNNIRPFTLEEINQLDRNDINKIDRGATFNNSKTARDISDVILFGSAALPLLFLSHQNSKSEFFPLFVMTSEAILITGGLTLAGKEIFNRTRPFVYNPEVANDEKFTRNAHLSFFSGHTSVTATFSVLVAKVINDYHPHLKKGIKTGLWSFALTLPAAIGYLRVEGGRHFITDVAVGYAIGAVVGYLVPQLHKRKKEKKLSLIPFNYNGITGLNLTYRINKN